MDFLKKLAFKFFPNFILDWIKKYHYLNKLKKAGETEEEDLLILKRLIIPSSDVIDIGANFGLYTKFMSKYVGNNGRVLSFEPIPETFKYLKNNIEKLKLKSVKTLNLAISDKSGRVLMQVPTFNDNRKNFYEAKITEAPDNSLARFEVDTQTLDEVCLQQNFIPAFIKCDVEGHEWFVFKGAEYILSQCRPLLFIEINVALIQPDQNTNSLLNLLFAKGYQLFINNNGNLKKWENEKRFNYYFLTAEHVKTHSDIIV